MLGSFAVAAKFGFLITVAMIFVIAAVAFLVATTGYAFNVVKNAFWSRTVQIVKIQDSASANADRASYLIARAEELAERVRLDALYEIKVPALATRFGPKDDLKFLDPVKITVQGVNLPEVAKGLWAALPDDQITVTGEPEAAGTGSAMRLELKDPGAAKKSWLLHSDKPATGGEATREIIDQAIYKMVYYLYYDPISRKTPPTGVNFPTERALAAFYSGQQYLGAYQQKLGTVDLSEVQKKDDAQKPSDQSPRPYPDLDEAEKQFRILYQEMPEFTEGLMLLGITLMEQKKETEAIDIFDRVKDNLFRKAQANQATQGQRLDAALNSGDLNVEEKKALVSAMLFRATAKRKLYRVWDNHLALAEIQDILPVIGRMHRAPANATQETDKAKADRQDFLKIHISVLAEKAYVLGAYLILLHQRNFDIELKTTPPAGAPATRVPPPAVVALTPAELANLATAASGTKKDWLKAYRDKMTAIHGLHTTAIDEAKALFTNPPIDDDKWKSAVERFRSDLDNAAGYAQFRHAQADNDVTDPDDAFLAECAGALKRLQKAHAAHQNEQTILLNLGLIESYPRCDRAGLNIERARKYLKQASTLKPGDYYPAQLLATLGIREMYTWGPFAKQETLNETIEAAEKARMLRPEDGTILALVAQAHILRWAQTSDDAQRKQSQAKLEAAIALAEKHKATPVHLQTIKLQWLVVQAARAADDAKFNELKKQVIADIAKATKAAEDDPSWYGYKLEQEMTALSTQITPMDPKDRATLRWPY